VDGGVLASGVASAPRGTDLAALSSADTARADRGAGANLPVVDWSSLDQFFAAGSQVDDTVPDAMVDSRLATSTWNSDVGSDQIQDERDDYFATASGVA
jgi:hypothetical protein